jgi:hypothetical protein
MAIEITPDTDSVARTSGAIFLRLLPQPAALSLASVSFYSADQSVPWQGD